MIAVAQTMAKRRALSNLYLWGVVAAGGLALALYPPSRAWDPGQLITLAVLFAVAEYYPIRFRIGATAFSFPMAYAAFALHGTGAAAWVAAAGTVAANLARRRQARVVAFNGSQYALAAALAGELAGRWFGAWSPGAFFLPLLLYLAVYYLINNTVVDLMLWLRLKAYPLSEWWGKWRLEAGAALVSLAYAAFMMALAPQGREPDPLSLIFFFLPLLGASGAVHLLMNLSRATRQMNALLDVSALATAAPGGSHVLDAALAHLDAFLEYRYAVVYQVEGDELVARAIRGLDPEQLGRPRIPLGQSISGLAAALGQQVVALPAAPDQRLRTQPGDCSEGEREEARVLAATPLVSEGQVLGVLTVGKAHTTSFDTEDRRLLRILANLLAAIVRNSQRTEEREQLLLAEERNRLAREIHDGLAQSLAGALLQMDHLERLMATDPAAANRRLHTLREQIRESLLEVRRSIHGLRPSALEAQGLAAALREEVAKLQAKGAAGKTRIRLLVQGRPRRLSALVEDEVFRVLQEGLTNVLKHAGASQVTVALHFGEANLRLTIRDNGAGFRLADAVREHRDRQHFGLTVMSERAERLGAQFEIESSPGQGTRLILDVPLLGE